MPCFIFFATRLLNKRLLYVSNQKTVEKKMKRRQAYLTLNLLPGIGPGKLRLLLQFFKGPEEILTASRDKLLQVPGIGYKLSEIIYNWRNYCNPEQEIHLAKAAGVYLITPEDEAYPAILQSIHDPPICLYV